MVDDPEMISLFGEGCASKRKQIPHQWADKIKYDEGSEELIDKKLKGKINYAELPEPHGSISRSIIADLIMFCFAAVAPMRLSSLAYCLTHRILLVTFSSAA